MAVVQKRESAKRDLVALWVWYAENANIDTAERFLVAVDATAKMLAGQPFIGTRIPTAKAKFQGIRRFPVADGFDAILLFYFPFEKASTWCG